MGWGRAANWAANSCPLHTLIHDGADCWAFYSVPSLLRQVRCVCSGRMESAPGAVCLAARGRRQVLGPSGPRHGVGRAPRVPLDHGFPRRGGLTSPSVGQPGSDASPAARRTLSSSGSCRERLGPSAGRRLSRAPQLLSGFKVESGAVASTVAKGRLRWEVRQAGSPAAGGRGPGSLPPPGREWRPATEARPAACSPASPGG